MATWKKVLVSGSDIHVASITASNVPEGSSGDRVLVRSTDGGFKSVTQGSIQGTTVADFQITGSTGKTSFDGTGDVLLFTGSAGTSVDVSQTGTQATVTVNLPEGTISGSSQITLAQTIGFDTYSSSLATDIASNLANITGALDSITDLENSIQGLVDSSSQLIEASASIATDLNNQSTDITNLQGSIGALETFSSSVVTNDQTGSFVISASVIGTADEIEVTANGEQGIQIGLPDDITIPGILEAEAIIIQGQEVAETGTAIISGSTTFGVSGQGNTHRFTGSLQITGALNINNTNTDITISELTQDDTVGISDLIARSTTGILTTAGTTIGTAISGAFDLVSSSLASDIAGLETTTTTTNVADISALQTISQSLVDSASFGIRFTTDTTDADAGSSIALGNTASFTANGDGLSVTLSDNNIEYTLNATTLGNTIGAFSQSAQLQNALDSIYVQLSDVPISGAEQLQDLGFITASNFFDLVDLPSGLISESLSGTGDQGTIRINNNDVAIAGLGTGDSPTFDNLTVTNNLTVNGDFTSLNVDNLNIEDQFILINSGAVGSNADNDKDGGLIVDNGGGSGSLFMYDFDAKAWGFRGATDNKVNYDAESVSVEAIVPEVYVGTVSSSAVNPSAAPLYGNASDTAKGQMHINSADSSIWIYV